MIFDYVSQSVLDGSWGSAAGRAEYEKMKRTSEPFVFGIAEGRVEAYLSARGFEGVVDVGSDYLAERYLLPRGSAGDVKAWWRIVHARSMA